MESGYGHAFAGKVAQNRLGRASWGEIGTILCKLLYVRDNRRSLCSTSSSKAILTYHVVGISYCVCVCMYVCILVVRAIFRCLLFG